MSNKHMGSCLCGQIRYEIEGNFESFFLCHCKYCQKDTGSAHAANLFTSTATLNWLSGQDKIAQFKLPTTHHTKSFCLICGSAVPSQQTNDASLVVPAGILDSKVNIKPNAHIFVSSRANWDHWLEKIPSCERLPS